MKLKTGIFILCLLTGSGAVSQEAFARNSDLDRVSKDVAGRIDFNVSKTAADDGSALRELLSKPLTEKSAVQAALLNNQSLQATLASWGAAKADFNRTRLPKNPTFSASVRFPGEEEPYNDTEFAIEQDFLSIVLFPLKSSLAGAEFDQAELLITKQVLDLAFEAKAAFYEAQAADAMLVMRERVLAQADAARELAKRQFEAGNINELNYSEERSRYQDARLEFLTAEADLKMKEEDLNHLMGFGGEPVVWTIPGQLAEVRASEPSLEDLQFWGMNRSLEFMIARKRIEALRHALALSRWDVFGHPEVGVSTERDVEGGRVTGPSVKTELPVFNLGQTEVMYSGSRLKEAEWGLKALEGDIRSRIKQSYEQLLTARSIIEEYRESIIPVREKITQETLKHYNYMLLGNYDLVRAKQNEILGRKEHIEALKNYWIVRSDLERAMGSSLPFGPAYEKKSDVEPAAASTGQAHQHGGSHV